MKNDNEETTEQRRKRLFLDHMTSLMNDYKQIHNSIDAFEEVGLSIFESPFVESIFGISEKAFEMLGMIYKIDPEAMDWFVYEARFGDQKDLNVITHNNKEYLIDSIEKFYDFEMKSNEGEE